MTSLLLFRPERRRRRPLDRYLPALPADSDSSPLLRISSASLAHPHHPTVETEWSAHYERYAHVLNVVVLESDPTRRAALDQYYRHWMPTHLGDSGVDLMLSADVLAWPNGDDSILEVNLGIAVALYDGGTGWPLSFYLYGRSSLSQRSLALANGVGIIDAGYRGGLSVRFRRFASEETVLPFLVHGARLVQLCAPDLKPIRVVMVDALAPFGTRGNHAWGSTGWLPTHVQQSQSLLHRPPSRPVYDNDR